MTDGARVSVSAYHPQISDIELGERLRLARENAKITQADAASEIGVSRTTVVAIEQGHRRIRIDELQKLAQRYGTSANTILRQESVHLDLVPQFRKHFESQSQEVEEASQLLSKLVASELELENVLGVTRPRNYPPERPILPGNVALQAEHDANDLRGWLGLGPGPVLDLLTLVELQLGVRVYVRPFASNISGLFAYDETAGACMLFNANHPVERVTQSCAHEIGHLISTRRVPEALFENERFQSREEKYANCFAHAFLTPSISVRQKFAELTSGQTHLNRRHVILLAATFAVSREAIVRRLEELELVRQGTWNWFQDNGGISNEQAREVLGETTRLSDHSYRSFGSIPHRMALLVREASKRGIYSEGQLAQLLHSDRHEVRAVLDGLDQEVSEANELVKIVR